MVVIWVTRNFSLTHDDVIKWKCVCVTGPLWGVPPVIGGFPSQSSVMRSFGIFFDLRLNKRFSKHSRRRWFETPSCSLWRYRNAPYICIGVLMTSSWISFAYFAFGSCTVVLDRTQEEPLTKCLSGQNKSQGLCAIWWATMGGVGLILRQEQIKSCQYFLKHTPKHTLRKVYNCLCYQDARHHGQFKLRGWIKDAWF